MKDFKVVGGRKETITFVEKWLEDNNFEQTFRKVYRHHLEMELYYSIPMDEKMILEEIRKELKS